MLLLAAPAGAQAPDVPVTFGADDYEIPGADGTGTEIVTDASGRRMERKFARTSQGFSCWAKNAAGQKIMQTNVVWHWSWWLNGDKPDTMRYAANDPVFPSDIGFLWSYEGSYYSSVWYKAPAMWYRTITSHFQASGGPFTINRYLNVWPYLWTHGKFVKNCSG